MDKGFSITTVAKVLLILFSTVFFSLPGQAQDSSLINLEANLNDLVYDISRSIVTIEATQAIYPKNYSNHKNEAIYSVISTGLIYDSLGYIITLASSVVDKSQILVQYEGKVTPAVVVGVDYQSGLALLKMHTPLGVPIRKMSKTTCAGQMLLAVGNSYGVRAAPSLGFGAGSTIDGSMQFTASLTQSMNGGGLFTLSGKLIGVISGTLGSESDIGVAIPAHKLHEVVNYLLTRGDRLAGYIGVSTTEIGISPPIKVSMTTPTLASRDGGGLKIDGGLLITSVNPNSPAAKAGLRNDDLIFQANGRQIDKVIELANFVKKSQPGTVMQFDFLRHNNVYSISVPIAYTQHLPTVSAVDYSEKDVIVDSILKRIEAMNRELQILQNRLNQLR